MKVFFSMKDRDKILAKINEAMGDRALSQLVRIQFVKDALEVTISKLGTSTLSFKEQERDNGLEFVLASEKIAFAHRAFKDEVTSKIVKVIQKAGGQVS